MAQERSRSYVDSLRLSERDQQQLLEQLAHSQKGGHRERRDGDRLTYRAPHGLVVQMRHPGGSVINYLVQTRNISQQGIGFLHGSFVYDGTPCVIALKTLNNKLVTVEGKVAHCRYVSGHVHDVGVRLAEPIDLRLFVTSSVRADDCAQGSVELPQLSGRVLYVEDSVSDQELVRFHLERLGIQTHVVSNGLDAVQRASSGGYGLVLTGVWLPGMTGPETAEALREQGYKGPIVALTADERAETRIEALARGCTEVLVKPYRFQDLIGLLRQHLPTGAAAPTAEVIHSELWPDPKMRPLIRAYLRQLDSQLRELQRLAAIPDTQELLRKLTLEVKGSAGGYGYPQISQAAQVVFELALRDAPAAALQADLDALVALCAPALRVLDETEQAADAATAR